MIERLNREIHRRTRCRRQLPGRRQRADARMRAHTVRDRERVDLDMSRLDDNLQEAN